jgi:vitamin-K-epoxide reductase (warfarin-sensitive)
VTRFLFSLRLLILLIALAGVVDSSLALKVHYDTGAEPCSINEHWDCGIVNHSPFSVVYGVPVAAIGIAGYLLIAALAVARRPLLLLVASGIGLAFAIYLSGVEKNVLQVWCLYCVISQGLIALITLLSLAWLACSQIAARRRSSA